MSHKSTTPFLDFLNGGGRTLTIDLRYTVHMSKFYTIEELLDFHNKQEIEKSKNLIIGETTDRIKIGININSESKSFGKITMIQNGEIIECDYPFELFAKYAQYSPKQPEIYGAEQNDATFLAKRLSEGWDCTTSYQYQDALSQAASHNSHEALEILLKAGARLKFKTYREHKKAEYDERTMEILGKYHKEE